MASEAKTKKQTEDAPLIDLNEAGIKKLMSKAKRRGYITVDELNEALPQEQMNSEQIEDVMSAISEMGVNIVENDEEAEAEQQQEAEVEEIAVGSGDKKDAKKAHAAKTCLQAAPTIRYAVPARNGRGRTSQPRGRNRHRQADRGRARHDDHRPVQSRSPSMPSSSGPKR